MIFSFDPGTVNLGYAILNANDKSIITTGMMNIKSSSQLKTLIKLNKQLYDIINEIVFKKTLVAVVIEKQVNRNPQMRQIESSLVTFFITLNSVGILNCDINLFSAKKKFDANIENFVFLKKLSGKKNYRNRKKEIQRCVEFIYKRKYNFDISDSIMQAYCYINNL